VFQKMINCQKLHRFVIVFKIWFNLKMIKNIIFTMSCCKLMFVLDMLVCWIKKIPAFCYPWPNYKSLLTTCVFLKAIKLGDKQFFAFLYINTNFTSNHQQLTIQTNIFFAQPNCLEKLIEFPFKLPRLLVITTIWENISFCPNTNNIKGNNYIHWHIKGFKVLLQCGNWTMP